ncbi:hypothetical protein GHT06_009988 [Daphnia sinensis]|uniref:Uncharacterized protein n=1 Tax=Daphnia sinensis TaxID=1820382 RepID=A0AAD5L088_9CRUS|nr:hypothetical protein GHT06_009988 [Daphnia sinensis]
MCELLKKVVLRSELAKSLPSWPAASVLPARNLRRLTRIVSSQMATSPRTGSTVLEEVVARICTILAVAYKVDKEGAQHSSWTYSLDITEVLPAKAEMGGNKTVGTVIVETEDGEYRRPVVKLCLLKPVEEERVDDQEETNKKL